MEILQLDNKYMGHLLNSISDGILALDYDQNITWHNKALGNLFVIPENNVGKKCYQLLFQREEVCENCQALKVFKTGVDCTTTIQITDDIVYSVSIHCIKDEDGKPIGVVESIQDISKQERTRLHLEDAREKAETANREKSEFFANISHEIRTPLNAIIGFSELLQTLQLTPQKKNYVNAIVKAGRGLLTIINDILDISKVEAGRLEIKMAPLNIKTIVFDTVEMFQGNADEKNLYIETVMDTHTDSIILDQSRLRQILINLIGNSLKFTEEGGVTVSIVTTPSSRGETSDLVINIIDTGVGIDVKFLDRVFDVYSQDGVHNPQGGTGTGLGLAITKKLVDNMGGKITVSSDPGKGTTFTVHFKDIEIPSYDVSESSHIEYHTTLGQGSVILVVDDIESNRYLLSEVLNKAGAKVYVAENGAIALEMAERIHPDLIIMDIRMPIMNGLEANRRIKQMHELKHIPVVALTASARTDELEEIASTFEGCLLKPLSINKLYAELGKYLELVSTAKEDGDDNAVLTFSKLLSRVDDVGEREAQELSVMYAKCRKFLVLNEVKDFSNGLRLFAKQYDIDEILCVSNQLDELANMFDFQQIEKYLETIAPLFNYKA